MLVFNALAIGSGFVAAVLLRVEKYLYKVNTSFFSLFLTQLLPRALLIGIRILLLAHRRCSRLISF